ncbi:MAG: type IV secretory system conjugative DNA transfer family protein [Clostridium sp.]
MIKKVAAYAGAFLVVTTILGFAVNSLLTGLMPIMMGGQPGNMFDPRLLLQGSTYLYGGVTTVLITLVYLLFHVDSAKSKRRILKGKGERIEGGLENARFMDSKEKDSLFDPYQFTKLGASKKDGIPVYAVYNTKKKELDLNIASPMHGLIIGATGSGKTTTFINPMIQILGNTIAGSSMICTDPKGELFQLHSKLLVDHGYSVMVLDLRDPYSSFRWNPLGDLYDRYQQYLVTGDELYQRDDDPIASGLTLMNKPEEYETTWFEYEGKAYGQKRELITEIKVKKQKIYDEMYEDLNDLISVICPIESQSDPVWEKGARSIIMAVCLAMMEDSEFPELEMTREKFCFYNINKALNNSDNNFEELRNFFKGRSELSKSVGLSKQVLSAAENTLSSYMSIALDKMSMFNDEGLCSLTSATDIDPTEFASKPTVLFLKIPDEKDTRHALAAVFILCIYKALIKVASVREDLSLPRNVYFILDEFGNMPKIDKFDKMITVGRSRKIWFNMVVQSYAQLNNVYGDTIANIIKSNCGMKMFIGSNDIETCEEFSKLCGNMTISTSSVSSSTGEKKDVYNVSSQLQTRPLIYPSELQKLNNKTDTGNAIIVTFGNNPLKTKFTPSYKCPLYKMGTMDMTAVKLNAFFGEDVYYDLGDRNFIVLSEQDEDEQEVENETIDVAVEQDAAQ